MVHLYHKRMPRRVDHQIRKRPITDAVVRITVKGGLASVTFREVAAEAGVSVRLVQYYFGTKDQLLLATQQHVAERSVARIRRLLAETNDRPRHVLLLTHGLGHMLGIDVHDVGRYYFDEKSRALEPGVVMTVEPGLYISPDAKDVPAEYLGIGVRIEDDVLCTANGPRVLTSKVPKQAEEIEALMAR